MGLAQAIFVTSPASYLQRRPEPGDIWRSRDRRDNDLEVTVLDVWNDGGNWGWVRIQRFRKSTVSLRRFHKDYQFVRSLSGEVTRG